MKLATLALALPLGLSAAPMTVEDLNQLASLHSTALSPSGDAVVYAINQLDGDTRQSDLYRLSLTSDAEPQRLTYAKGTEQAVRYHPDGKGVFFLSARSGSSQLWYLPLSGGEARQVSDLPVDIADYRLDATGQQVALQLRIDPSCDNLTCAEEKAEARLEQVGQGKHYDSLMVRHWDSWGDGLRNQLFVATIEGESLSEPLNVTAGLDTDVPPMPFSGMEEVAFTPDGKHLVFTAKAPGRDHAWHTNYDLWQVPVAGGKAENLTPDNTAWDAHPVFSADGRYLAWLAMSTPGYEADRFRIMLKDLFSGEVKEVAPGWDRSPGNLMFAPDTHTLLVSAQDLGQVTLFAIDTRFGDVRALTGLGSHSLKGVAGDRILYTRNDLSQPTELFSMDLAGRNARQLTNINGEAMAKLELGEFDQFQFKGWNDETVYGYWIKPAGYQEGETYPVAFLVHGGPQGSFGNRWHGRWNAQLWATAGFGVVMIDFHGSTGYGQEFTHSISKDWGGKPLIDLQKGLAAVGQQQPWLDVNNACAAGGSYGGYMMNWIAGQWPEGFKCLVNHAGLFDMRSFYMVTEELWFPEYEFGGSYWDAQERYEQFNPVNHIDKWNTPMLVLHGAKDYRVPLEQGLAAYTVLQRKNIPSELVVWEEENHWILNKDNLEQWYSHVLGWMQRWTDADSKAEDSE
ncbi:S9 family peptidase [Ferrimonas marina]|uniref:Dipeptidyl aminopeptidase/acylaminoacyl peptidase n=1 Tax=Ferrimonas marina TaxID=299255 RepID=A0A1M5P0Q0_9GAMM|nr:S9 family peptidase [Ferrimonas marina]SHG95351.1 Dipeptidyl aminopeptidase/acylaminoacyl peptidase [Ferrimonas marina]